MQKQKIELNLPANLSYSSLIRHISDEIFSSIGFSQEWSSRLKLVVDELYMNAVRYGSTQNFSEVKVVFSFDDIEVNFRIEDDGTGKNKISADQLRDLISQNINNNSITQTSGRGLALISKLWTDDLMINQGQSGGIVISFTKKLEVDSPPSPPLVSTAMLSKKQIKPQVHQTSSKGKEFTIKLLGEIDQTNIDSLVLIIDKQVNNLSDNARLVLDFEKVLYINSTFIGHLASWYNDINKRNGILVVKNANTNVLDIIDLVGLGNVLTIENNSSEL